MKAHEHKNCYYEKIIYSFKIENKEIPCLFSIYYYYGKDFYYLHSIEKEIKTEWEILK